MDEIVKAAMLKWPSVPDCYGWLALDARGQWRMRDEACQRTGGAGDIIRNPALQAFICRNYQSDEAGNWYFQNGPQRVFVELEVCPWICRLTPEGIRLHTGAAITSISAALIDEQQRFYLSGENKLCLLDDRDTELLINCIQAESTVNALEALDIWLNNPASGLLHVRLPGHRNALPVQSVLFAEMLVEFQYIRKPAS